MKTSTLMTLALLVLCAAPIGCGGSDKNLSTQDLDETLNRIDERLDVQPGEEPAVNPGLPGGEPDPVVNPDEVNPVAPNPDEERGIPDGIGEREPDATPPRVRTVRFFNDSRTVEITFTEAVDFQSIVQHESIRLFTDSFFDRSGERRLSGRLERVGVGAPTTVHFIADRQMLTLRDHNDTVIPWRHKIQFYGLDVGQERAIKDLSGNAIANTFSFVYECDDEIPCQVIGD